MNCIANVCELYEVFLRSYPQCPALSQTPEAHLTECVCFCTYMYYITRGFSVSADAQSKYAESTQTVNTSSDISDTFKV